MNHTQTAGRVTQLNVYPVKSIGGLSAEHLRLDELGVEADRRYMLVDPSGSFISQRCTPRMALITPLITPNGWLLNAPNMPALELPVVPDWTARENVSVWGDTCIGAAAPDPIQRWFQDFLENPAIRLVALPEGEARPVDRNVAHESDKVGYADGFPLLITNQASLRDLNTRLDTPVTMKRFRPNIVVDGFDAFAEHDWKELRIGAVTYRVVKPCERCSVVTVDPSTGERSKEPLRTLATYQRIEGKVIFGQNAIHNGPGEIRIGDPVEVLA